MHAFTTMFGLVLGAGAGIFVLWLIFAVLDMLSEASRRSSKAREERAILKALTKYNYSFADRITIFEETTQRRATKEELLTLDVPAYRFKGVEPLTLSAPRPPRRFN